MKKTIIVGGIHGVGKTTLCESLSQELDIEHYTASDLIKKIKADYKDAQDKRVTDINDNQTALVLAIERYVKSDSPYFLDGHFCLLSPDYSITRIPDETFRAINPSGIIVFFDDISKIQQRLLGRDENNYDQSLLTLFQDEEIIYSKEIGNELQIPYLSFKTDSDTSIILKFVRDIMNMEEK